MIVKGPFNFKLGSNVLAEIEKASINYAVDTSDHTTLQGHKHELEGAHKVTVAIDLLESDVPSLAIALPQFFVPNGGTLSSGETVTDTQGAIDVVPGQCENEIFEDLIITACGTNAQLMRVMDCKSRIDAVTVDNNAMMVTIMFVGFSTVATVQFFRENSISLIS